MNYQSQQYKVLPALAMAYAVLHASRRLHRHYTRVYTQLTAGNTSGLGEVITIAL